MVQLLAKYTGRGPTKAGTTIGRDNVLVVLADTLTKGERSLADAGFGDHVLETRSKYQQAMRNEAVALVERLTGRTVIGFMSDNHLEPDLGAEIFIFARDGGRGEGRKPTPRTSRQGRAAKLGSANQCAACRTPQLL